MSSTTVYSLPRITVVVPIRNERNHIVRCLGSIFSQEYPAELVQILVIDGSSDDGTLDILAPYIDSRRIHLIHNPGRIPAAAMNLGLEHAHGELLVRVDGHAYLGPGYLSEAARLIQVLGVECVGGTLTTIGSTPFGEVAGVLMSSPLGVGGAAFRYARETRVVDTVAFGMYKTEAMRQTGRFDTDLLYAEDDDYNFRFSQEGYRIILCPSLQAYYVPRGTIGSLYRQYWNYGKGRASFLRKHGKVAAIKQLVPTVMTLIMAAGICAGILFHSWIPPMTALSPYIAFLIYATVNLARRVPPRLLGWVPIGLIAMHFGYGLGFLRQFAWSEKVVRRPAQQRR